MMLLLLPKLGTGATDKQGFATLTALTAMQCSKDMEARYFGRAIVNNYCMGYDLQC